MLNEGRKRDEVLRRSHRWRPVFSDGTDKAFLDWHGRPLWRHQLDTLHGLGAEEVFVCAREGQDFLHVPVLRDAADGLGPLSGIERALAKAANPRVLVLAVDLPDMATEFLRERLLPVAADDVGAVPKLDGFYEPLAAVYPRRLLDRVRQQLGGADRSLQSLCRWAEQAGMIRSVEVIPSERALFRNLNSPDDLG